MISRCCCRWTCASGCPKTTWFRGPGRGGRLGSGRVPPPVPGRWSRPGGVRPGDDGRAVAVWLLPGRAVQPGDRKAVRARRRLPGDRWRAASRSCDHRPVPGPASGALGGLFSQVLRLLAAEGMVSLGTLSLDGTKLAGNAAQKASKTLPQIDKLLAEAAKVDAAEDAQLGDKPELVDAAGAGPPGRAPGAAGRGPGPAGGRGRGAPGCAAGQAGSVGRGRDGRETARGRRPGDEPPRRTGRHRAAGKHHRPGRAGDAQPEGLCGRLQRPARGHRARSSSAQCCASTRSTAPCSIPCLTRLPGTAGSSRDRAEAAYRARRRRLRHRGKLRPRRRRSTTAAGPADQRPCHPPHRAHPAGRRDLSKLPATARARRRMRHHRGRADYKLRAQTVEPVFGQIKTCQKMTTMSRRGFDACHSEWLLACHRPQPAQAALPPPGTDRVRRRVPSSKSRDTPKYRGVQPDCVRQPTSTPSHAEL